MLSETDLPLPPAPTRGRLKVFLGAAPGVGKTYAMLEAARGRKGEGIDVVAGLVETHDHHDGTSLAAAIETVPPKLITHEAHSIAELDVDAILRRHPALVLIDDFAHVNAPGSWHPRRFQDVEQILEAGIDVYTTLNIQHLESLNDVVAEIAHIRERETIPDSVLQSADDIALIDLPPEELLARLRQGKVHVPEAAARAMTQFFTLPALTALRELALRYAAERVDQQMLNYRQAQAVSGVWATRERIIVCLGDAPVVTRLVRVAKRAAERRKVPWIALYVETAQHHAYSEAKKSRIAEGLRLAEQLGAEVVTLVGDNPADEIMKYAKSRNATQIIVGKSERSRLMAALVPSVTDRLLRQTETINILVITPDQNKPEIPPTALTVAETKKPALSPWDFVKMLGSLAIATAVSFLISLIVPFHNYDYGLIYLTTVMLIAIRQGHIPAVLAALVSVPLYDFLFVEPRFSPTFLHNSDIITFVVFVAAALIISNLAARVRGQIEATRLSERRSKNLYDFNRKIAGAAGLDDVLWAVAHHVAATVGGRALVMLPRDATLSIAAGYPPEILLDEISEAAADWAWRQGKPAGRGSNTLPAAEWLFLPLKTARGTLGALGVHIENKARLPSSEEGRLLETLSDQAAIAIERTNLVSDFEETRLLIETEKLRSALLSSLSHDLRTPLVSILASTDSLIEFDPSFDAKTRKEALESIRTEAERLHHFMQNLLDMTRLGAGALQPKRSQVKLGDIIVAATTRLDRTLRGHKIVLNIAADLPPVLCDSILIEQVLVNLIDNACKYSFAKSPIVLNAAYDGGLVTVQVCDQGKSIPVSEQEKVFDMFYRVKASETQIPGTGLGLAICRGIVEAHGGTIRATDAPGGGTCIEFTLPVTKEKSVI